MAASESGEQTVMKQIPAYYFSPGALKALEEQYREIYRNAEPFPHVVIDNFLDSDIADLLEQEFPGISEIEWKIWGPGDTKKSRKKEIEKVGTSDETKFGPFTRHFMHELHSHTFLSFVEGLTGIKNLIPDPSFNGCGLHSTGRGGKLMVHTDANRHPIRKRNLIHQYLNLIYYVNKDWDDDYGGHLELWNRDATRCVKKIAPVFNRAVLFETGKYSYHGHPEPLKCPEGRRRNSLAVYYYVLTRPDDERYEGIQRKVTWAETTPEEIAWKKRQIWIERARKCVPPLLWELPGALRRKVGGLSHHN